MNRVEECSVDGCVSSHIARGLCNKHYLQWSHKKLEAPAQLNYELHGMYQSKTYNSWRAMKSRCLRPTDIKYSEYGGRGITICNEWINSFKTFLKDMGVRPEGMTIDRIDPDGNYEPTNCRWAVPTKQTHNQRLRTDNKSGHKGVFFRKDKNKWIAYININSQTKRQYLGFFDTYQKALEARLEAESAIV